MAAGNLTVPGAVTSSFSPLFRRIRPLPAKPVTTAFTWNEFVVHAIITFVMLAFATVPVPLVTTQVWLGAVGWVATVTAYVEPASSGVGKANMPSAVTVWFSLPLCKTTGPRRPVIWPPTVNLSAGQLMTTLVTGEAPMVPVPPLTTQVCAGGEGWVRTVTAKALPLATGFADMKVVAFAGTVRLSPPLFCSTRPLPVSPVMEPPTVNVAGTQVMATSVMPAAVTVPVPAATVHSCEGAVGCASTVTA